MELLSYSKMHVQFLSRIKSCKSRKKGEPRKCSYSRCSSLSLSCVHRGPSVKYLGRGDQHNTKYDGMALSKKLHETFTISKYSGVPLNSDVCPFTIKLYASDEYRDIYMTNNAIIFSISVVLIFAFVTFVFSIYDSNVERRQKVVLNTAEKTSAIVSSLFPTAIREQMLQPDLNGKNSNHWVRDGSTSAMASLYPETTIFFADLAGFTAWSR
jgi:hypothetical protein